VPSLCTSSCNFQWTQTATPTVTNIDTSNAQAIVLTGSGFDATNSNNNVLLGTVPCVVTASTATQLTCTPGLATIRYYSNELQQNVFFVFKGPNPVGTYTFSVNIANKGLAQITSQVTTLTFSLQATAIAPTTTGTGGGVLVTINGQGFSSTTRVQIDSINCPIQSYTYSTLTCLTPPNVII